MNIHTALNQSHLKCWDKEFNFMYINGCFQANGIEMYELMGD